jgi:hypothetical protein
VRKTPSKSGKCTHQDDFTGSFLCFAGVFTTEFAVQASATLAKGRNARFSVAKGVAAFIN